MGWRLSLQRLLCGEPYQSRFPASLHLKEAVWQRELLYVVLIYLWQAQHRRAAISWVSLIHPSVSVPIWVHGALGILNCAGGFSCHCYQSSMMHEATQPPEQLPCFVCAGCGVS